MANAGNSNGPRRPGAEVPAGAAALGMARGNAPRDTVRPPAPDPESMDSVPDAELESEPDSAPPSIPSAADVASLDLGISRAAFAGTPVLTGDVIADRYEVLGVLGEGGMGIVYRCRDLATDDAVAIKRMIVPEGSNAGEYLMWFYKEARALAALNHPSIVRARDFGQLQDGSPYLAMDLATGISLHDLSGTRLTFPIIWSIVDQILNALAHAHARGVVHGDLKPSNVLVQRVEGEPPLVHVLDFGLAWLKQDPHDERLDGEKALEFAPHAGAGTPGYMAPEQIQHEMHHVSGATDIYALGCILYKLLSRRAPFNGDSKDLLRQHAYEPLDPLLPVVEIPDGVVEYVHRMLAKRPWERWEFAAGARADWAKFRPNAVSDNSLYELPEYQHDALSGPSTRRTGRRGRNPGLRAVRERAPGLLSIRPSPIVGREAVRQLLRETCDELIDGEGPPHRLILLVGTAGSGKSRIAEWLCEVVHEEGSMVPLKARYRPLRGPLDGMLGAATQYFNFERADRDTIERSLLERWNVQPGDKSGRAWVAGAAEWFRPLGPISDAPLGPSGMRFTLDTLETRRMVTRYTLRKIANGRPLLFWMDDLHHGGQSTFEGLLRIHSDEPDQRIVIIATVRSEDVHLGTPAAERLRNLRERMNGTVVEIEPLDLETTQALLRASLPLDDAAVQEAARRSRGNPLFALQQLHAWALAGDMRFEDGVYRVPADVLAVRAQTTAELWDSRVAAVPEEHRAAAYAAAPLGSDLRREVLRALLSALGVPADAAILSLQNAEIIIPRGHGRYSWPHALLQEHLLNRLDERADRQRIFRAAAAALMQHPLAGSRRIVRQRAVNLLRAGDADLSAQLLFDFLQQNWNGAREPLATLVDLDLLEGHLEGRSLALKNRWRAEALRHVGRTSEAMEQAEVARSAFEQLGDHENVAHCLRLLGHLSSEIGNSAEGLERVRRAHAMFETLDHTLGMAQCEAVAGEIEYLLGAYESARETIVAGERHFALLDQPLGRGQCLLLLSWVEHSEGAAERSRRLTLEARAEFERAGYRLGTAQANASLAHVEHRLMNFHSAELGARDALIAFETLRTPRGQAACERLLSMIAIDTDDLDMAELHAERSQKIYETIGDRWGIMESKLLSCQVGLMRHNFEQAAEILTACSAIVVEEAEPRQHYLLTQSWLLAARNEPEQAFETIEAASEVFGPRTRAGDHTPHLLARLSRFNWPEHARDRIEAWRALLNDRARRAQD